MSPPIVLCIRCGYDITYVPIDNKICPDCGYSLYSSVLNDVLADPITTKESSLSKEEKIKLFDKIVKEREEII